MSTTVNLGITKLDPGLRQPEFVVNDALDDLDAAIGGALASWTPTWAGFTLGDGTVVAKYKQVGKLVFCRLHLTLGSTSSVSGSVTFTLPVTSVALPGSASQEAIGPARLIDASPATGLDGAVLWNSTTTGLIAVHNSAGTYLTATVLSSSVPFTWAVNDKITATFFYEAA